MLVAKCIQSRSPGYWTKDKIYEVLDTKNLTLLKMKHNYGSVVEVGRWQRVYMSLDHNCFELLLFKSYSKECD